MDVISEMSKHMTKNVTLMLKASKNLMKGRVMKLLKSIAIIT